MDSENNFNYNNQNNQRNYNYTGPKIDPTKYKPALKYIGGFIVIIILLNIFISSFIFTVDEREQVVVKQFNEIVKIVVDKKDDEFIRQIESSGKFKGVKIIEGKGIFFKLPFVQSVESYSNMLLTYDTNAREVITLDKKKLVLDNFAQWRISNPALFSISLGNINKAHTRIDDILYSKLNEEIGKVDAHVVISDKVKVAEMLKRVIETSNQQFINYGIKVVDIRIKRTDLPEENYENIFNRMKTERDRAAKTYRSEGKEEAQKIRSSSDKEATVIEAKAYEEAEQIKGQGDAEALKIYADAYNQDPEFYAFWRTLQVYRKTLKEGTVMVIEPDSEIAKYLFKSTN